MRARLYYEAHITVEEGRSFEDFRGSMNALGWRASRFDEDDVDDYSGKWFVSARAADLDGVRASTGAMIEAITRMGYTVLRWKVEDTLFDSKHGDILP